MRRAWFALLILLPAFSGCSDDGPASSDDGGTDGDGAAAPPALEAPTWAVGDWWTYQTTSGTATWVVTEGASGHWTLDIDNEEFAFFEAMHDDFSIGQWTQNTYMAVEKSGGHAQFWSFPLEDMKAWSMTLHDETYDVVAHRLSDTRYHIMASQDDIARLQWTYDADIRWFKDVQWLDDDGTVTWQADNSAKGTNHTGEYVRYTLDEMVAWSDLSEPAATDTFTVAEGTTDLWLAYHIVCPDAQAGEYVLVFQPPPETTQGPSTIDGECAQPAFNTVVLVGGPAAGDWTIAGTWPSDVEVGVFVQVLARTLETASL